MCLALPTIHRMAGAEHADDVIDQFLSARDLDATAWERDHDKKRCPDCGGVHDLSAQTCTVCGWAPEV